jgi:uncharacterized Zn-finger protein
MKDPTREEEISFGDFPMTAQTAENLLGEYLQIPVALRRQGETQYKCPYCQKRHTSDSGHGHFHVACDNANKSEVTGIVIGERFFLPTYGVTIVEYIEEHDSNKLIL